MIRAIGLITGTSCYILLTASSAVTLIFICNNSIHDIALTASELRGVDFWNDIITIDGWHVIEVIKRNNVAENHGFLYVGIFVAFAYIDGAHILLKDKS